MSSTRLTSTSCSLCRYFSSRSKSSRLAPCAAVRTITPPPSISSLAVWRRSRSRSLSSRRRETPIALAGRRVDHVAPGDRQLHRQARALRLQRVLDDLHDDLLAGFEQVGDLAPAAAAAAALRRLDARQHDLVDVQEAVLLEADVDERRLQAGQDVVDLALVDVADDRAPAAALDVELGDAIAGLRASAAACASARPPCAAAAEEREAAGVPLASRSATRVSARSTLTSTCFFNVNQSFGIGWGRARRGRRDRGGGLAARSGDEARRRRRADAQWPAARSRVVTPVRHACASAGCGLAGGARRTLVSSSAGRGPSGLARRAPGCKSIAAGPPPTGS